jgi:hypothetical protein
MGIAALAVSTWQYRVSLNYLWSKNFAPLAGVDKDPHRTPLMAVAIILLLIGIFTFLALLFRMT